MTASKRTTAMSPSIIETDNVSSVISKMYKTSHDTHTGRDIKHPCLSLLIKTAIACFGMHLACDLYGNARKIALDKSKIKHNTPCTASFRGDEAFKVT